MASASKGARGASIALYLALAVFYLATLTRGDLAITAPGEFRAVYDALGDSLWRGEVTLPRAVIGPEAFITPRGRVMYFGPLPALPRMVLNALAPSMHGRWSILSCAAALLVAVWACRRAVTTTLSHSAHLGEGERAKILRGATVTAVLGSPLIHLATDGNLYFEAIAWSAAAAFGATAALIELALNPRCGPWTWAAVSLWGAVALLTRVTFGAAVLLAGMGVGAHLLLARRDLDRRARATRALALALPAIAGVAAQLAYNHARWGAVSRFVVPEAYVLLPQYAEAFAQGQSNPRRVPWALYNYLVPSPRFTSLRAPFIVLGRAHPLPAPVINGTSQGFIPLTLSAPALLVTAWRGLRAIARDRRWLEAVITLGFAAQALVILGFYHVAQRYTVEFLPGLLFLSCTGLRALPREPDARRRVIERLSLLVLVAVATNVLSQTWWVQVESAR